MNHTHDYAIDLEWTGNRGTGTSGYKAYGRDHIVRADGKPDLAGSADRAFFGDRDRWNPEELLLTALSQCHMLSYLHVAFENGIIVTGYQDAATGTMEQTADGGGHFVRATLRPVVTIDGGHDPAAATELAQRLHHRASELCFIAASVNFPVEHEPRAIVGTTLTDDYQPPAG